MKYELSLRRDAVGDMGDAEAFYLGEQPGLEKRFREEVALLLRQIQETPEQFGWSEKKPYRKATMRNFPFCIYYRVLQNKKIVIVAVHNAYRDPRRWQDRAKP